MLFFFVACTSPTESSDDPFVLPAQEQRIGDPDEGLSYLLYGDYIGSGIPIEVYNEFFSPTNSNPLNRTGEAADLPYVFNIFDAPNGVSVVGGINCFGCHSNVIDGEFYIGIGNAFSDYTSDETGVYAYLNSKISSDYGLDSPEWEAYKNLGEISTQLGEHIITPFAGVNPAFALEEGATQYRNPLTLQREEEEQFSLGSALASDTPPWWHIQKKHGLYYNAVGRGDMSKLLMQICVVGVWDSEHAQHIEQKFPDVLAYLMTIEPPPYPNEIDANLASTGKELFLENCSSCHGTYDQEETYPNRIIPTQEVGTDPALAQSYIQTPGFLNWLQESWFAQEPHPAEFVAVDGYLAPPLDGIWATAPYLHNASVPNLESLLHSSSRPTYWKRDFSDSTYDHVRVGWPFTEESGPIDTNTYNTTRNGYGNQGHTYGDILSSEERKALIEYLKTL